MQNTLDISKQSGQWDSLVKLINQGNEIVLAKQGKPLAKVVPLKISKGERTPGLHQGMVSCSSDFDDPLPSDFWSPPHPQLQKIL